MAAVTSIMRAQQILLAELDGLLRPHGLTFARYEALVLITFSRAGELPMRTIGQRLMVHPTSVRASSPAAPTPRTAAARWPAPPRRAAPSRHGPPRT
jgi:hypothetical protein